jgi:hypothetical protein
MSLFEDMNKKKPALEPEVSSVQEVKPVAAEEVVVEEPVVVEPVKAEAPVSKYKYTSWWKSPEYEKQVAELANVAEKRRETDKKQAKWNRNVAIFSDIARLGVQVGANAGGAYMIDRTTPFTDKATEKLERLRKEHAAEIEGYAQKLKEAKLKDREDLMNRNIAEMKYKQADDELKYKIAKDKELRKRWEAEQTVREENAETNKKRVDAYINGGGGSGVNRDVYLINDDGTKKVFKHAENANNIQAAYAELPSGFKVQKEVKLYDEDRMGRPVLRIDAEGVPVTRLVENTKPTLGEMRQKIEEYNARALDNNTVEDWTPEEDEIIDYKP